MKDQIMYLECTDWYDPIEFPWEIVEAVINKHRSWIDGILIVNIDGRVKSIAYDRLHVMQ